MNKGSIVPNDLWVETKPSLEVINTIWLSICTFLKEKKIQNFSDLKRHSIYIHMRKRERKKLTHKLKHKHKL